jgi:hypothetical protein
VYFLPDLKRQLSRQSEFSLIANIAGLVPEWSFMLKFISPSISKIVLIFSSVFFTPLLAAANPTYAKLTGQPCATCHVDSGGGGAHTTIGLIFMITKSILFLAMFVLAIYGIIRILRYFKNRNNKL